jgi:flagellar biosynthesis protein FlhF
MKLRTFRAATMHEALAMVRRELGPDAALLHTRQVRGGWLQWLLGPRLIEVTASCDADVPSRLPGHTDSDETKN